MTGRVNHLCFYLESYCIIFKDQRVRDVEGNADPVVYKDGSSCSQDFCSLKSYAYSPSYIALWLTLLPSLSLRLSLGDGLRDNQSPLMIRLLMEPEQCSVKWWERLFISHQFYPPLTYWGVTVFDPT